MNAPSSDCLWLAAFPKSGSTWFRFLVHNLLFGPPRTSDELNHHVPSIHDDRDLVSTALRRGGLVLTHKALGPQRERFGSPQAAVVVVRHPADVALSDANHFVLTQLDSYLRSQGRQGQAATPADAQALASLFLTRLLQDGHTPKQDRLGMGTWAENVGGWLDLAHQVPTLVLRYEDLKADGVGQLARVAGFLGLEVTGDRLRQAVAHSSFGALRQMQEAEIANRIEGRFYESRHEAAYALGVRFVNQGLVGRSRRLPPQALERIAALFGPTMARCGYGVAAGEPLVGPAPAGLWSSRPLPTPMAAELLGLSPV